VEPLPLPVPQPLAHVAELLQCPHCGQRLSPTPGALRCPQGHSHDIAREGYVTLLDGPVGRAAGDDAAMVAARVEIEQAGHLAPLTAAIVETALARASDDPSLILDLGAGTGSLLAEVVRESGGASGVATDVSRPACRRAARAHPSLATVRANVWSRIPLGDRTVDLALNAFAPRNGPELARVVRPGGTLLVATPAADHLRELRDLHTLSIHPDKAAALRQGLEPWFEELAIRTVEWQLKLTAAEATDVLRMGPTARHLRPDALHRLATSPEPILVCAAVELRTFSRTARSL
jgi:23S rRNA (guanine745-N1)-methyltransferase